MPQFNYCKPFSVFDGNAPGSGPTMETSSLKEALTVVRTRPHSSLTISVLVIDGDVSTLIPVTLTAVDLAGKDVDDADRLIASSADRRFRSMTVEGHAAASA